MSYGKEAKYRVKTEQFNVLKVMWSENCTMPTFLRLTKCCHHFVLFLINPCYRNFYSIITLQCLNLGQVHVSNGPTHLDTILNNMTEVTGFTLHTPWTVGPVDLHGMNIRSNPIYWVTVYWIGNCMAATTAWYLCICTRLLNSGLKDIYIID